MALKETIEKNFIEAMKSRNEIMISTLRLLRAAIKNKEIELRKSIEDQDVISLIRKMLKQAEESLSFFKQGNREDLIQKVQQEMTILKPFLPDQMNPEDLKKKIQEVIQKTGATSPKQMGEVMKSIASSLAGACDMKEVSRIVRELLSK